MTDQTAKLARLLQEQKALAEQKLTERAAMWIGEYEKLAKAEKTDRGIRSVFRVTTLLEKKKYTDENRDQWVVAMMQKDATVGILNTHLHIINTQIQALEDDRLAPEDIDRLIAGHGATMGMLSK